MTETLLVSLFSNIVTLLVAVGGWVFGYLMHADGKRRVQLERKISRLEDEVRARIALEKTACDWLSTLTKRSLRSVQLELRQRAQERSGLRPKLADSDLSQR